MWALGCVGYLASVWTVVCLCLGAHVQKNFVRPLAFYENALSFAENNLSREDLNARPLFENPDLLRNVDLKRRLGRMHQLIPLFNRPVDVFGICFVVFWL